MTTKSLNEGGGLSPAAALSCLRNSTASPMSTSSVRTNSGAVALDSAIRRAIVCWSRVSSSIVVSPLPVVASPDLAAGFAASASGAGSVGRASSCSAGASSAGAPFLAAAWTSDFTIRPPGPEPGEPGQLDAELGGHPARDRGRLDAAVAVARRLVDLLVGGGDRRLLVGLLGLRRAVLRGRDVGAVGRRRVVGGLLLGRGLLRGGLLLPARVLGGLRGAAADRRDRLADRERVALLGHDLERAGLVGLIGHVGLVGLDLDQLVAAGDLVPVGLEPLQDRALLHRVGQAGHRDIGHARSV